MKAKLLVSFVFLLIASATASAQNLPALSNWKNDRGSTLSIWWAAGDQFKGLFTNFAAGFECQGMPYPAVGKVNPDGSLFFVVTFSQCNTVTTWHGRVAGNQLPTRWSLVYVNKNGIPQKLHGKDIFTRQW
jgi:Avidin family